jgi:hypothetical protein
MQSAERQEHITQQDLAAWGVDDVAYVKSVRQDGNTVYAIHAADGTQMAIVRDRQVAWAAIRQHDLEPVSVH